MAEAIFLDTSDMEASLRKISEAREKQVGVSSKAGWCGEDDQPNLSLQSVSMLPTRMSAIQRIRASAMSSSMVTIVM